MADVSIATSTTDMPVSFGTTTHDPSSRAHSRHFVLRSRIWLTVSVASAFAAGKTPCPTTIQGAWLILLHCRHRSVQSISVETTPGHPTWTARHEVAKLRPNTRAPRSDSKESQALIDQCLAKGKAKIMAERIKATMRA